MQQTTILLLPCFVLIYIFQSVKKAITIINRTVPADNLLYIGLNKMKKWRMKNSEECVFWFWEFQPFMKMWYRGKIEFKKKDFCPYLKVCARVAESHWAAGKRIVRPPRLNVYDAAKWMYILGSDNRNNCLAVKRQLEKELTCKQQQKKQLNKRYCQNQ